MLSHNKHILSLCSLLILVWVTIMVSCASVSEMQQEVESHDWPIFRGSPSLSGYTLASLPAQPKLLWSHSSHTRTVASPIVYNSMVYTLSRKGELRAFTLSGDSCAFYDFKTPIEASFVVTDSVLYVGRIDGYVTALSLNQLHRSPSSVRPLWEYETFGQISGSPNLVGDNLLVGSYDNSMYTFNARTGKKTGQFETGYYINGTASVWHRYMVFGGCDSWVRVVDISTGIMTDSLEFDSYVPASPAILDGVACACDYNGNVYEMVLTDGKISSHRKLLSSSADNDNQEGGAVSMPTLTTDAVYILSGDRHVSCIDRQSGGVRWRKMLRGDTGECSPLVAKDKVLVCTKDGHVSIFDASDGEELWHYETGEPIVASPAIIGDRFFILTTRGTLLCFN